MDALSLYAQQTRGYDPLAGYQRGVALAGQLLATQAQQQQQVFNNLFEGAKMVNQRKQFEANLAQRQEEVAFNQNMEERKLAIQQQQFDEKMKLDQMRAGLSMANTAARMQSNALRTGAGGEVPRAEVYESGGVKFTRTYDSTGKFTDRPLAGQGGSASTPAQSMQTDSLGRVIGPPAVLSQGAAQAPTPAAGEAPLPMVNIGPMGDSPNPLLPGLTPDMQAEADRAGVGLPATTQPTEPLRTPAEVLGPQQPASMEPPATITQADTSLTPLPSTPQTGPSNAELVSDGPLRTQGQGRKFQDPQLNDAFTRFSRGEPQTPYYFQAPTSDGKGGMGVIYRFDENGTPQMATINNGSMGEFKPYGMVGTVPIQQQPVQAASMLAALDKQGLTGSVKVEDGQLVFGEFKPKAGTDTKATGSLGYIAQIKNPDVSKALTETALKALEPISEQDIALDLGVAPEALTPEQIESYRTGEKGKRAETVYNQMLAYYGAEKMPMTKAQVLAEYGVAPAPADPTQLQQTNPDGSVKATYVQRPKSFTETQKEQEGTEKAQEINQVWTDKKNAIGDEIRDKFKVGLPDDAAVEQELDTLAWDTYFEGGSIGDMVTGLPTDRTFAQERILKRLGYSPNAKAFDRKEATFFTKVSYQELLKAWARSRLTERGLLTPTGTRAEVAQDNPNAPRTPKGRQFSFE